MGTAAAGGARAGGGGGAGADALADAAFSALGLDALSAGVATAGNIVDAALRLGVDAVAAGADAAAVAHKLLCFGPAAAGLEDPSLFSENPSIFLENSVAFPGANADGDDGVGGGGADGIGAVDAQSSAMSSARTARESAQAQLRRAQSVLSALTAGGPASVRGETAAAAAVLEALAMEELRAAGAASVQRRKTAPYAGGCVESRVNHARARCNRFVCILTPPPPLPCTPHNHISFATKLGQAPIPRARAAGVPWGPRLRARLYALIGRLSTPAALTHLYRPGMAPPLFFGAAPPTRRWAPVPHADLPEVRVKLSRPTLRLTFNPLPPFFVSVS